MVTCVLYTQPCMLQHAQSHIRIHTCIGITLVYVYWDHDHTCTLRSRSYMYIGITIIHVHWDHDYTCTLRSRSYMCAYNIELIPARLVQGLPSPHCTVSRRTTATFYIVVVVSEHTLTRCTLESFIRGDCRLGQTNTTHKHTRGT